MSTVKRISTSSGEDLERALEDVAHAVRNGQLVVLPTDTVYGIAADAFSATAVQALLDAKGRGRQMPPPVLIHTVVTLDALATDVPEYARALAARFWPGPLTLVCHQQPSLTWDLGETRGTVAVRIPDDETALTLLERTGPLAVSSANLTGRPAARDADEAEEMLGDKVAVIVDAGLVGDGTASTIIDATTAVPRVLRWGVLGEEELAEVLEPLGLTVVDEG